MAESTQAALSIKAPQVSSVSCSSNLSRVNHTLNLLASLWFVLLICLLFLFVGSWLRIRLEVRSGSCGTCNERLLQLVAVVLAAATAADGEK